MPSLLEMWMNGTVKKYPPLPAHFLEAVGGPGWEKRLAEGNKGVERVADLIYYDENRKVWDRSMED